MISPLWQFSIEAPYHLIHIISETLEAETVSATELKDQPNFWRIDAIFEEKPDVAALEKQIHILSHSFNIPLPSMNLILLPQKDWLAENRKSFHPLQIGSFYIYGSLNPGMIPDGSIPLHIEATTAFGTGHHPTTQGCLIAIEALKGEKFSHILDLGCGTGILALAMGRLFHQAVTASDNDIEAIRIAQENVNINHTPLNLVVSEGFDNLKNESPFDLITANILADVLIEIADDIGTATKNEAILVLSGILGTQAASVTQRYEKLGFSLQNTYPLEEWVTLVMQKSKP